MQGNDNV